MSAETACDCVKLRERAEQAEGRLKWLHAQLAGWFLDSDVSRRDYLRWVAKLHRALESQR